MTTFVYLHGFNSAFDPNHQKVKTLEALGTVIGITYDSTGTYTEICDTLLVFLNGMNRFDTVLVGTSLGAFWAGEMAFKLGFPSVLINPCYDPTNMLQKYVGEQTNFATGETKTFELASALSYGYCRTHDCEYDVKPIVFLDMGDEIIDHKATQKAFISEGFSVYTYNGGSHRFDHMELALPHIREYANICSVMA